MIGSIVQQNKSLSDAGKTPKDTSPRLDAAKKASAKVSSEKVTAKEAVGDSRGQVSRSTNNKMKGSFQGLNTSPGTVLQFKNTGYDSKINQLKRYNKSFQSTSNGNFGSNSFTSNKSYSIMNNYSSVSAENSSSDRLSKIVKNNMMF